MSLVMDDEVALGVDSRYKAFVVAVEKVLKQFEHSTGWADLIPILVKVKKTLETYAQFHSIPKRLALAKRLAQCLHPALPSGVHLATLEVYETIFRTIDRENLQRDIVLYSWGLFPLLSAAALPVKPVLLTLYETYLVPLDEALNPVLSGFLIGLFSALEEGADYYDRVIRLLGNVADRIDEFFFYTCLWSAIRRVAAVRFAAITFILSHFERRKNLEDQMYLIGLSIETMVNAVCTCLHDNEQPLVQRIILDYLLVCLPLHKKLLTKVNMIKIVTMAFHILLKRDAGLSRRIYTWFLGTSELHSDNNSEQPHFTDPVNLSSYFTLHTQDILIESLRYLLQTISTTPSLIDDCSNDGNDPPATDVVVTLSSPWTLTKVIRVLLVLVEKSDVGPDIIEFIFIQYLLVVYEQAYYPARVRPPIDSRQENDYSETIKTFNMLLDTLEPYFIWTLLTRTFNAILRQLPDPKCVTGGATVERICGIIIMLLEMFAVDSFSDTQSEYLSELLCHVIETINDAVDQLTSSEIALCVEVLSKILKAATPTDDLPENNSRPLLDSDTEDQLEPLAYVDNEYSTDIYNKLLRTDSIGKLQSPSLLTEQQSLNDIEQLLRQMVRKVEKQVYNSDNPSPAAKRTRLSTQAKAQSAIHIEHAIKLYKNFFHRFVTVYLIKKSETSMNERFQGIYSVLQNKASASLSTHLHRYQKLNQFKLQLNDDVNQYQASFDGCCKLLVELCSFPRHSSNNNNAQAIVLQAKSDFEDWLVDLCMLSLCRTNHLSLQTKATSVLIEIFGIISDSNSRPSNNLSINLFCSERQISSLLNGTDFFRYIVAYLWEYLCDTYGREYNLQASHTLALLHSMLPCDLCEDLICAQLSLKPIEQPENELDTFEKYKRFFTLWNYSRQMFNRSSELQIKSFQRCLVQVLSMLKEPNRHCLKATVQQWVYDCFVHGDMCRIFDILLMMLIQSDTTRTDIHRVDLVTCEKDHLNNSSLMTSNADNEIQFSFVREGEDHDGIDPVDDEAQYEETDEEKRTRAISCMQPGDAAYPVRSSSQTTRFPSFSSLSQPILSNIRSLSPPVLLKATKARTTTMSPVLSQNNTLSNTIKHSTHAHSVPTDRIIITEESLSPSEDVLHSPDAYILLYAQAYDYERVTLSLNIIESLIEIIPEQLVHSLLTTSGIQSAPVNIHNKQMHELYLKHLRLIEGQNFDLSTEEHQSYLCLLLSILLIFTYSYQQKSPDIQENHRIHTLCLVILTRLCRNLSSICMENVILVNYVASLVKKLALQKIILCLFNRLVNQQTDSLQVRAIYHSHTKCLHEQLAKQYLKQLVLLLEEMVLLENIISSTDFSLIPQPIVNQKIFLSTILQYLKQIRFIDTHRYILSLAVRILPHCDSALKSISARIVEQICQNACFTAQHRSPEDARTKFKDSPSFDTLDYVVHLIERLTYICSYCLGTTTNNIPHFTQTLCPQDWAKRLPMAATSLFDARQSILRKFPLILSSLVFMWKTITVDHRDPIWLENDIKLIRETILELVSSLVKFNGVPLMRAVAQCWEESKQPQKPLKDNANGRQALIRILMNIHNFKIHDMIYHINELLVRQQTTTNLQKRQNVTLSCLQFLLAYADEHTNLPNDYWPMLAVMLKECLAQPMSSPVTFSIIRILGFFVKQTPVFAEKRDSKDFQEITMKVLENCNTVVASSLKQTTWRRKNFQVRLTQSESENTAHKTNEVPQEIDRDALTLDLAGSFVAVSRLLGNDTHFLLQDTSQPSNSSKNALTILAEHAANLLDAVYHFTDDKDRAVVPFLQTLVPNVIPYVRTHASSNASSYRAASVLLMNISHFLYTRKAWKKEVFEQFFDAAFFEVDIVALRSWKILIDNLITHGKSTFRDVVSRVNTVPTGIFSSKEQEYEQRAMLVKRFAFAIYASAKDQYNRDLPEILTCITDLLKLPSVPVLYTQLFLLLRVLLIRISSKNLVSFWPIIMSELIQVLLQLEQDLLTDIEGDVRTQTPHLTIADATLLNNVSSSNMQLKLYLYACKLLDILLAIPYSELYHFQLFRSAFVLDYGLNHQSHSVDAFTTFSVRLSKLFDRKLQPPPVINISSRPFLRLRAISNIDELGPFFHYLSNTHLYDDSCVKANQSLLSDRINDIELSVLEDFVESWN